MSSDVFINYWIGQEPNPPSPTLDQMPAYVDIVPLAFVTIDPTNFVLDFSFLTQQFPAEQIQGWIRTVKANGTKVLFSISDSMLGSLPEAQQPAFVQNVVNNAATWDVDGIDFVFQPPYASTTLIGLIEALRAALPAGSVFTAPVYSAWLNSGEEVQALLTRLGNVVDYVTTMDYTGYPGADETYNLCAQYAALIGDWSRLVVGISCMGPPQPASNDFTPLSDLPQIINQPPPFFAPRGGAMLYAFSYDVESRNNGTTGTGYPDGSWTQTIHTFLP